MRFGVIGPAYNHRSLKFDCQRCINWYYEKSESGSSQSQDALIPTPGTILFASCTPSLGSGCRGLYRSSNQRFFGVFGDTLFEFDISGNPTNRGTLSGFTNICHIADNGINMMIVDGVATYLFTFATNVFSTPAGMPVSTWVTYQDTFYIFNEINTNNFYIWQLLSSGSMDTFSVLDVAQASMSADNIIGLISTFENIFVFGPDTLEIWYVTQNSVFPFARVNNASSEIGCIAPNSICRGLNTIFWLGGNKNGNGIVFMSNGYEPQRISDHAIEYALSQLESIEDAIGYSYQEEGHYFYVLNFPIGNKTFCYDQKEGCWHERLKWDLTNGVYTRHPGNSHAFFYNKNLIGDMSENKIYQLDLDTTTDNGIVIRRERVTPHLHAEMHRVLYKELTVILETGVGLNERLIAIPGTINIVAGGTLVADYTASAFANINPGDVLLFNDDLGNPYEAIVLTVHSDNALTLTAAIPNAVNFQICNKLDTSGTDPQLILQWSNDGGNTWGNEHFISMGRIGEYRLKANIHRLGYSRDRVFKFIVAEPVKAILIDADLDVQVMNE